MSKFNVGNVKPAVHGPIVSEQTPSGVTYEGAPGYARDVRSELFLLAVANMVGENTFYEFAGDRDSRFAELVHTAANYNPGWTARFLRWLRSDANMRSASLVGAAEYVRAFKDVTPAVDADFHDYALPRQVVKSVLQRADEPGEMLAYWTSKYGRAIPKPIKRGVADAAQRLYNERNFLKWDSNTRGFRFGDVLELTHASPAADKAWQGALFKHAIDVRQGRDVTIPESLLMLQQRAALMALPVEERRRVINGRSAADLLAGAGMTWESVAGWLQGPLTAKTWTAVIPSMGYMALLRNLRNFDQAGVSDEVAEKIAAKLADPDEVAKSRQFPLRFLSAYNAAPSLRWGHALDKALTASLSNVPTLNGRTLILVDTSGSMHSTFSKDGTLMRWDAAAVFGIALGMRCANADVVSFSGGWYGDRATKPFPLTKGASLLREVEKWKSGGWFLGGGTDTVGAIRTHFSAHDRVVILTDEQATSNHGQVDSAVPSNVPLYTWNLAGYKHGHAPEKANRYTFGGLTDAGFRMIPLLEAGKNADWPF